MQTEQLNLHKRFLRKLERKWIRFQQSLKIRSLSQQLRSSTKTGSGNHPVVFFNASTRLTGISQNAAFSLIASWGIRAEGIPILYYACRSGMVQCVLGTVVGDPLDPMPCQGCVQEADRLTEAGPTHWFEYRQDDELNMRLEAASLEQLKGFNYGGRPLGKLVLPSLRWAMRKHDLENDPLALPLYRRMIASAHQVAEGFEDLLRQVDPRAVVVFNGLQFPEAVVKWISRREGIRTITHEVGFQPLTAFFSAGEATAYPIEIPDSFELTKAQDRRLDEYLQKRFQGDFTMAGIQFWSEMQDHDPELDRRIKKFRDMVVVFTNVSFDTSQAHANVIFESMFDWLDAVIKLAKEYPDTLFVIRAHPDELREGKESRETVEDWLRDQVGEESDNLYFIGPNQPFSSYEIIRKAKFSLVYNSSIGLEASVLGEPVLCGGQARYTQYPTVFLPENRQKFLDLARQMLEADEISVPETFQENARRFLYYQLFKVSLPFDEFLMDHPLPGYVKLKGFEMEQLQSPKSRTLQILREGILEGKNFVIGDS